RVWRAVFVIRHFVAGSGDLAGGACVRSSVLVLLLMSRAYASITRANTTPMPLTFADDWVTSLFENDQIAFKAVNPEEVIRAIFARTRQMLINADKTNGALLAAANGGVPVVEVMKGLHQDTQVSHNPRDKGRIGNFHITVRFAGATHHVYLIET